MGDISFKDRMVNLGKSSLSGVTDSIRSVVTAAGMGALHSMAPDNFESYMCSLELIDSVGNTEGFMTFPIMPNNIMENKSQIATITKTNTGVVTVFNSSFSPRDISIQGTFGRKLRLVLGMQDIDDTKNDKLLAGELGFDFMGGDVLLKTGYGLTKMLKKIIDKSYQKDNFGQARLLIFNNYAFNTSYVVEVLQSSFSQSLENNMLWYYSLEMKAIAEITGTTERTKKGNSNYNVTSVVSNSIAESVDKILNGVSKSLTSGLF